VPVPCRHDLAFSHALLAFSPPPSCTPAGVAIMESIINCCGSTILESVSPLDFDLSLPDNTHGGRGRGRRMRVGPESALLLLLALCCTDSGFPSFASPAGHAGHARLGEDATACLEAVQRVGHQPTGSSEAAAWATDPRRGAGAQSQWSLGGGHHS
jgi:hypothetical protein